MRYAEPKLKMMGVDAIRSSTPTACKEKMKHLFKIIMNGTEDDVITYIDDFRKEFMTLGAEEIFFPRSVRGLEKYHDAAHLHKKGAPVHVKAALLYNKLLKDHKLVNDYPTIKDGEKIKFAYLKKQNTTGGEVIGILNQLPKEFELQEFIDYDKMFSKSFVEPMRVILDAVGWQTEHIASLESFFGN